MRSNDNYTSSIIIFFIKYFLFCIHKNYEENCQLCRAIKSAYHMPPPHCHYHHCQRFCVFIIIIFIFALKEHNDNGGIRVQRKVFGISELNICEACSPFSNIICWGMLVRLKYYFKVQLLECSKW